MAEKRKGKKCWRERGGGKRSGEGYRQRKKKRRKCGTRKWGKLSNSVRCITDCTQTIMRTEAGATRLRVGKPTSNKITALKTSHHTDVCRMRRM